MDSFQLSESLQLYLKLNKLFTKNARKFSPGLDGIGFTELMIVIFLAQAPHHKMRRIDLAEKMGLTASGITRMLLPMEKLGLVKRESSEHDGRVSYVVVTESGMRNATEKIQEAELLAQSLFPTSLRIQIEALRNHINALVD